ncbi:MAG: hypothetical protein A2V90_08910 [Gammaproteobacteria bacterium RBG_16_57_12]|nr:MAG: hypothetical protein A2V90_08910 [Gammaproteobacteria bacterium RBG_16_57_12]
MTIQQQGAVDIADQEKQVAEYLRVHPQFFDRHTELLAELRIPHPTRASISLIERQVVILRDQNRQLRGQLKELMAIARDNDQLHNRLHRFMLALLETDSLDVLLRHVKEGLHAGFAADAVAVRLFVDANQVHASDPDLCIDRTAPGLAPFMRALQNGKPLCGHFACEQLQPFFGDKADAIASVVVLPFGKGQPPLGLLAIGSHDPERFHPAMGTVYLQKMGEVLTALIRGHIK